ncbi:VOC family protein [Cellulomonas sp. JZ18]|uniref:VOC family protein n=1 Tax=Cellulomonas sp. JZ18 TaxID=2654191 RepID=UPI0018AF8634|nr:VOC family protein [Cellulomonas sp. JZ18]
MTAHAHGLHHTIDYVEIPVTDLAAARAFYAAAFGWSFVGYGDAYAGIRTAAERGTDEAGGLALVERDGPVVGGPLVLVCSDDLEATAAAVVAAGGGSCRGRTRSPADAGSTCSTPRGTSWACGPRADADRARRPPTGGERPRSAGLLRGDHAVP